MKIIRQLYGAGLIVLTLIGLVCFIDKPGTYDWSTYGFIAFTFLGGLSLGTFFVVAK